VKARQRRIVESLLSAPTAPFREAAVVERVAAWAAGRGVAVRRDEAGNVLLRVRRGRRRRPRWVFAAHMDHPGFIVTGRRGRSIRAEFRGSVARRYFAGSAVRLYAPAGEVRAIVRSARKAPAGAWLTCRLDPVGSPGRAADVPAGTIGMWDLPAARFRRGRLHSRACDDVAGAAAVICAMDEIAAGRFAVDATALLTRAEEAAFIGALAAARARSIPAGALVVAVECSRAVAGAGLGEGVVVRVGDRVRTFDPSLTAHVSAAAETLGRRDRRFRHVRQLMPGGTCESTAYAAFGYRATGLCLPMANYHNQGPGGRIAAEVVDTGDFEGLVKLLTALARDPGSPADTDAALKRRLDGLWRTRGKYLRDG